MVAVAGTRIGWEALADLSEASISRKDLAKIHDCLNACPRIRGWHRLRTRRVGREVFVDLHVTLDADMRVREAHDVVDQLEEQLQDFLKQPANIITHIEPHEP
jgi:divalent metal cation (Fe/Co/Zn/Cd) transporter